MCVCVYWEGGGWAFVESRRAFVTQATRIIRGNLSNLVSSGSKVSALTQQQHIMTDDCVTDSIKKKHQLCAEDKRSGLFVDSYCGCCMDRGEDVYYFAGRATVQFVITQMS